MTTFQYQDGPAGSGKTYGISKWTVERVRAEEKVLIAQPSKDLIRETVRNIKQMDPNIKIRTIVSSSNRKNVVDSIVAHMQAAVPHHGEVLLITHKALDRLPKAYRKFWHLVCDEIPSVFNSIELKIPITHRGITDHIKVDNVLVDGISLVEPRNKTALEDLASGRHGDQNLESFKDLANLVLRDDVLVVTNPEHYADLIDPSTKRASINFFGIKKEDFAKGWKTTTFLGANFFQTELYHVWSRLFKVSWQPHGELASTLRYTEHHNGERLKLTYLFERKASKQFYRIEEDDGTEMFDAVWNTVVGHLNGKPFIWQVPADRYPENFSPINRLPGISHGLDKANWKTVDNVVLLSVRNQGTPAWGFLKNIGMSDNEIAETLNHQNAYQAMMRCSLRDPLVDRPVEAIVPDRATAEWLAEKFEGCTIEKMKHSLPEPSKSGRPSIGKAPMSQKERNARNYAKRKAEKLGLVDKGYPQFD
ncbi:DEAD/DEAH box helicase family protein [Erythrobacteraceae bacterium WH01K]|nr:DEAD/DEAH box helicase family protein [Erythrobacteraceae bacterium WH01K]